MEWSFALAVLTDVLILRVLHESLSGCWPDRLGGHPTPHTLLLGSPCTHLRHLES
jgi:hypothetical protein